MRLIYGCIIGFLSYCSSHADSATKPQPIVIQSSKFPQHFKISIKWHEKIPYQVEQNGQETIIVFDRDTPFEEVGLSNLPFYIEALETKNIEGSLVTKLKISPTAQLKHSWEEGNFIINILNEPSKKPPLPKFLNSALKSTKSTRIQKPEPTPNKVIVTTKSRDQSTELIFDWDKPVKMVALHWGDNLILAFDQAALFDLSQVEANGTNLLKKLNQLDIKNKSVLVLPLSRAYKPKITKNKFQWVLEVNQILDDVRTHDIAIRYLSAGEKSSQKNFIKKREDKILLDLENVALPITLDDPQTGYQLLLFPSEELIPTPQKHVQFDILPSSQGLAILSKDPLLTFSQGDKGIEIQKFKPFSIASSQDCNLVRKIGNPQPLIDFKEFTIDNKFNFRDEIRSRENEIAYKKGHDREKALVMLTHLCLLEGLTKEALGQINTAIKENPKLLNTSHVRALRALAAILDKDEETLSLDIHSLPLQNEPDAEYLKALYQVAVNIDDKNSYNTLIKSIPQLLIYPPTLRSQLGLLAAETAIRNLQDPLPFINLIDFKVLGALDREHYEYYIALSLQINGKEVEAKNYFKKLENGKNMEVRVRSKLALVEIQVKENEVSRADSIRTLETLKLMWTGDQTELKIFELLGHLYAKEKNYIQALTVFREAHRSLTYLPQSKNLQPKMVKWFEENILKNEKNSPMDLIVFYREFQSFMPEGEIKPLIQLKLIEAFIGLDLLEDAEKMLEAILKEIVAEDIRNSSLFLLADIYVRDRKFRQALDTIKDLKSKDLSDALSQKKFQLTFKSLLGLTLFDQASDLIDAFEQTHDTNLQRLELAWNRKDWKIAQNILSTLVYDEDNEKFDPQLVMNLAVASFFNDDTIELKHLRENFTVEMNNSNHAEAFDILTRQESAFEPDQASLAAKLSDLKTFENFIKSLQATDNSPSAR